MGKRILVPVDRSPHSKRAFEYVLDTFSDPTITVVHVLNPVNTYYFGADDDFNLDGYQAAIREQTDRAEEMLEEYRETAMDRGSDVRTVLTSGRPAKRILETAESHDVDHIVMGSRGRSGVERVLLGSVAETVTRRAEVPVTIVR